MSTLNMRKKKRRQADNFYSKPAVVISLGKKETGSIAVAFLLIGIGLILISWFIPKGTAVLWCNAAYAPVPNLFFKYITHLGDGLIFVPLILLSFFAGRRFAVVSIVSALLVSALANFFKHVVFTDFPRPKAWFGDAAVLQFVEGVKVHSLHSFPSGHTATAAAVAVILALIFRRRYVTVLVALLALLVGVSRVYLAQHFFVDVSFGYFLGSVAALAAYQLVYALGRRKQQRHAANEEEALVVALPQNNGVL